MDPKDNLNTLLAFTNRIYTIVGLKKISIGNGPRLITIGYFYKAFASLLTLWLSSLLCYHTIHNLEIYNKFRSFCLTAIFALSQYSAMVTYLVTSMKNLSLDLKITKEFYSLMFEIDTNIQYVKTSQNDGIRPFMVFVYALYGILRFCQIYANQLAWSRFYSWTYNSCCILVDLQMIRFVFEINAVARRFEVLNCRLKCYLKNNCGENKYDVRDGLLMRLWRTRNNKIIDVKMAGKDDLERLMSVYNKLVEVVDMLNSCYGLLALLIGITLFCAFLSNINPAVVFDYVNIYYKDYRKLSTFTWMLYHVIRLCSITTSCEILHDQISKTNVIVSKLFSSVKLGNEYKALKQFGGILECKEIKIRAKSFFVLDYSFLFAMMAACTSFTIILVQLKPANVIPD